MPPATRELHRIANLTHCVQASAEFFKNLLAIPTAEYMSCSFVFYSEFAHNMMSLFALSNLREPSWDRAAVRDTVDLVDVLDHFIGNFPVTTAALEAASALDVSVPHEGHLAEKFNYSMRMMKTLRDIWASELSKDESIQQQQRVGDGVFSEDWNSLQSMSMGMSDEGFFPDFFMTTDYFGLPDFSTVPLQVQPPGLVFSGGT